MDLLHGVVDLAVVVVAQEVAMHLLRGLLERLLETG